MTGTIHKRYWGRAGGYRGERRNIRSTERIVGEERGLCEYCRGSGRGKTGGNISMEGRQGTKELCIGGRGCSLLIGSVAGGRGDMRGVGSVVGEREAVYRA